MRVYSKERNAKISLARKGMKFSQSHIENCRLAQLGKTHSAETKLKISKSVTKSLTGKKLSEDHKHKLSIAKLGRKRFPHSDETKKKMRIAAIRYIQDKHSGSIYPRLGKHETEMLDQQEQISGCKIERQFQIKNLGYFVDGYCLETNTVYEVYEKDHSLSIERDAKRESEIRNELQCEFVILWDR